jgi:hypothetical protein
MFGYRRRPARFNATRPGDNAEATRFDVASYTLRRALANVANGACNIVEGPFHRRQMIRSAEEAQRRQEHFDRHILVSEASSAEAGEALFEADSIAESQKQSAFFSRLPPEIRRAVLIQAFGNEFLHMDLGWETVRGDSKLPWTSLRKERRSAWHGFVCPTRPLSWGDGPYACAWFVELIRPP